MRLNEIQALMAEIGTAANLDEVTASTEQPSWLLTRDEIPLVVDYDETRGMLAFVASLGPILAPNPGDVHQLMLRYNALSHLTAGARLGLDAATGYAQFLIDVPAAGLDLGTLVAWVDECVVKSDLWLQIVSGQAGSELAGLEGASLISENLVGIRC